MPPVGGKPGPKRERPERLQGDTGLRLRTGAAVVAVAGDHAGAGRARTPEHGSGLGVFRWFVERTIAWLHTLRSAATPVGPAHRDSKRHSSS